MMRGEMFASRSIALLQVLRYDSLLGRKDASVELQSQQGQEGMLFFWNGIAPHVEEAHPMI